MKAKVFNNKVVIYQAKSGAIELRGDIGKETVWATQAQIADIFDIDRTVATKHIGNVLKSAEVATKSNVQKMHFANSDKPVSVYSLDVILAVGYRANSAKAISFRKWATGTLRKHLIDGYTINRTRIAKNYGTFLKAVEQVKLLLPAGGTVDAESALELIKMFADTWVSLDAYDKDGLPTSGANKKQVRVTADDLQKSLQELKAELTKKGEASDLFGHERQAGGVAGIVGNVFQSFGGKDMYSTVEEKAAHLLYFMIKNHPYSDGNKRHGAFAFVWFLGRAKMLRTDKMTPTALTSLTLLIAESDPAHKDRLIGLVLMLLKK